MAPYNQLVIGVSRSSTYLLVLVAGPIVPIALSLAGLIVARALPPSVYGQVAYFFSSFNLITILWQLGLSPLATGEVARSIRTGGVAAAARVTPPYLIARLVSLAVLIPVGIGAALLGDPIVASATAAAAIALLATFAQALAQGLGRASLVAGTQIVQALLYLAIVAVWAKEEPERVFLAVSATYAFSLLAMAWASQRLVPNVTTWWSLSRGHWRIVGHAVGWLYGIALLMTPFSSLAVLTLGSAGRFDDAAAFSIGFTIPLLMSVSAATIISIQYYPHLCHLLADAVSDARRHFDLLYRLLAWAGLSVAVVLLTQPGAVISVLFTSAYAGAIAPLTSLAPAAFFLPVVQLGLWTLIAHRLWRWATALAATELGVVIPFIAASLFISQVPLWLVGVGHTLASAGALGIAVLGLRKQSAQYDWRPRRIALAAAAALPTALWAHAQDAADGKTAAIVLLLLLGAAVTISSGLVMWSPEIWPVARAHLPGRVSGADRRSADASFE
jgi:O-antigen/teichoic acid export membrane protein